MCCWSVVPIRVADGLTGNIFQGGALFKALPCFMFKSSTWRGSYAAYMLFTAVAG